MVVSNYTFDASAKTVTFNDFDSVDISRLALITNVTDGVVIYQFQKSTKGATVLRNVVTLEYDTTDMEDTDLLRIDYNVVEQPKAVTVSHHDSDIATLYDTQIITGSAVSGSTQFLIPPIDCRGYGQLTLEVTGTFSATLTVLEGETGSLLTATSAYSGVYNKPSTAITGPGVFHIPVRSTLIAIQCTAYTSGTPVGVASLSGVPFVPITPSVTNETQLTVSNNVVVAADTRAAAIDVQNKTQLLFLVNVTAVSGTTPTLDIYLDATVDGSSPYYRLEPQATTTPGSLIQITTTGTYAIPYTKPFGRFVSLFYKVGGTSPSFTLTTRVNEKEGA